MKKMIGPAEARDCVLDAATLLSPRRVPLDAALGAVLAEDIRADRDYPPFNRAMMDGFAVRIADAGREARIIGEVAAGTVFPHALADGQATAIMTGAPCPEGTQAVVPVEIAERNGDVVALPDGVAADANIAAMGRECEAATVVAESGARITPLHIANLAAFGYTEVAIRQARAALITTGEELARPGDAVGPGQIRNSNGPMLEALLRNAGIEVLSSGTAGDTAEALAAALEFDTSPDIVVLSGGVSAGKYDLVPAALEAAGVDLLFHKVTQKPGKPLLFGRKGNCLYFGLPGNPLACHACFHHYIAPAARAMVGRPEATRLRGVLEAPVSAVGTRSHLALCHARFDGVQWRLDPAQCRGSADIHNVCGANAYVQADPGAPLDAGTAQPFLYLGDVHDG